jgi:anhydro-N-acetylmuramic acid kinase
MNELFIGIMSGTSMDGLDAVILVTGDNTEIIEHHSIQFPEQLHHDISELITSSQSSLTDIGSLDVALAKLYSELTMALLQKANLTAAQITAIGCHGQTVCHQPDGENRFSMQLGSASNIAENTGITTVTDFRNRDMAAGGQGAPLVPGFHQAIFSDPNQNRLIINIGGIANCTWLPTHGEVTGFDIGPGNTLMDSWIKKLLDEPYDRDGLWAATGRVSDDLLKSALTDNYFSKIPPKSTGREYCNLNWLHNIAGEMIENLKPEDIQATLLQVTAHTIANTINKYQPDKTYLCGGGVHNSHLLKSIIQLSHGEISDTNELGIDPDHVEAAAFAWLACRCINNETGTISTVTGATHPVISGAIYSV